MSETLRITEIFLSLQGEARSVGLPTTFVRLTGCPLRCGYCDSEYAFYGGEKQKIADIIATVKDLGVAHVCVTGGEPLAQPAVHNLLQQLCDLDYQVSLETSGAMDIAGVDSRVSVVLDLKTPGSNEVGRNLYANIPLLRKKDQIKFVIVDRQDYEWARFKLAEYQLEKKVGDVLFSPCFAAVSSRELADWIVADRLPVRFQVQLHKLLWGDKPGV